MNSLSNGGRNVSASFAAALWTIDIAMEFARAGIIGEKPPGVVVMFTIFNHRSGISLEVHSGDGGKGQLFKQGPKLSRLTKPPDIFEGSSCRFSRMVIGWWITRAINWFHQGLSNTVDDCRMGPSVVRQQPHMQIDKDSFPGERAEPTGSEC